MTTGNEHTPPGRSDRGERATVLAKTANAMFRLQLTCGREVLGHAAQGFRMAVTRLLPGDQVLVEVSPFDPHKARICSRLETTRTSQPANPHSKSPQT